MFQKQPLLTAVPEFCFLSLPWALSFFPPTGGHLTPWQAAEVNVLLHQSPWSQFMHLYFYIFICIIWICLSSVFFSEDVKGLLGETLIAIPMFPSGGPAVSLCVRSNCNCSNWSSSWGTYLYDEPGTKVEPLSVSSSPDSHQGQLPRLLRGLQQGQWQRLDGGGAVLQQHTVCGRQR